MRLVAPQKRFGPRSFFASVLTVNLLLILAIDMYVPALPSMQHEFGVSEAYLNLTMFVFFLFSAVGVVLAGPVSDQRGRKPLLMAGCGTFAAASFLCAVAPTVEAVIAFRLVEAVGYGFVMTIVTALVKDAFAGEDLKVAMTFLQSLVIIGPAIAPFLGTLLLSIGGWREVFLFLTLCGVVSFVLACLITETHPRLQGASRGAKLPATRRAREGAAPDVASAHAQGAAARAAEGAALAEAEPAEGAAEGTAAEGGVGAALRELVAGSRILLKDRPFMSLALIMGVTGIPYFAFIAVVSYVLIDFFALSYFEYSVMYAIACVVTIVAPYVYMALSKRMGVNSILKLAIALVAVTFVTMLAFGTASPLLFLVTFIPYALAEGVVRPMAYVVLLDQPEDRVGAASSFANFIYSVLTSVATVLATLPWPNFIVGVAALAGGSAVVMTLLYLWGMRKRGERTGK